MEENKGELNTTTTEQPTLAPAERLLLWANARVGCTYLPGENGGPCTPARRVRLCANYPRQSQYIRSSCAVLLGKTERCDGTWGEGITCSWYNHADSAHKIAYGAFEFVLNALWDAGIDVKNATPGELFGDEVFLYRGPLYRMERMIVGIVYNINSKTGIIDRIGIYDGDGSVIYAHSYRFGIVKVPLRPSDWSNWALVDGLYDKAVTDEVLGRIRDDEASEDDQIVSFGIVVTEKTPLNMRRRPSMNSGVIAQIPPNTVVAILRDLNGMWLQILYKNAVGYAMSRYIDREIVEDRRARVRFEALSDVINRISEPGNKDNENVYIRIECKDRAHADAMVSALQNSTIITQTATDSD